jgi:hypothetical protein
MSHYLENTGAASVRQKRDYFTRPIIETIERLRCRMPCVGFQDVAKRLLGAVQGVTVFVIEPVVLKQRLNF